MESAWRNANSQNIAIWPHNLNSTPKKDRQPAKSAGGNRNPKHTQNTVKKPPKKNPRNQYRLPVANNLPSKPETTKQSKHNKEKIEIENVLSINWKNRVENRNVVTVTTRVLPAKKPRTSLENEDTQKAENKALSETNAKGKMQSEGSVCYL